MCDCGQVWMFWCCLAVCFRWAQNSSHTLSGSVVWLSHYTKLYTTMSALSRLSLITHLRDAAFTDVKVHYSPSLNVWYLSWRVALKNAVFWMLATKSLCHIHDGVSAETNRRNEERLTEMALRWSAWKCQNEIRVFVFCALSYRLGRTWEETLENSSRSESVCSLQCGVWLFITPIIVHCFLRRCQKTERFSL